MVPPMNLRTMVRALLVLAALGLASCGGADVAGVFLVLAEDGSAIVTTRSLLPQAEPGPAEQIVQGVDWTDRVRLVCSRGDAKSIAELRIDEVQFVPDGQHLRVVIPCGPAITWVDRFAPTNDARLAAARTFDPKSKDSDVGTRVTFEVEVPGRIVTAGADPAMGVQTGNERTRATLSMTVRSAREIRRTVVWDVTWK